MNTSMSSENMPATSFSWKVFIEGPVRHVALLLWLIGLWRLVERVESHQSTWEWVVAGSVATLVAFLLIAQLHWLRLSFVPIVLGLAVVLGLAHQFDAGLGVSCVLATIFAVAVWVVVPRVLGYRATTRISQFLGLAGGHGDAGGRAMVQVSIHRTGLVIVLSAIIGVAAPELAADASINPEALWTIALGAVFIWMTGWHYQHRTHSFLVIGSLVYGVWLGVAYFSGQPLGSALISGSLTLATLALSFGFSAVAIVLQRWRGDLALGELTRSLYRRALRTVALSAGCWCRHSGALFWRACAGERACTRWDVFRVGRTGDAVRESRFGDIALER